MRVFLTGATGFVGRHVAAQLERDGVPTLALVRDRSRASSLPAGVRILEGDLEQLAAHERAIAEFAPTVCVHLAWYVEHGRYLEAPENLASLRQSLALIELARRISCPRFVGAGTCFEYAFGPEPLAEEDRCDPQTLYARCKAALFSVGEALDRAGGPRFAWARLFYLFGPGEDARRLVPYVLDHVRRGVACPLADGNVRRDYLHVEDVARALVAIAASDVAGAVNVGSGETSTLRELLEAMVPERERALLGFGERPSRSTDPPSVIADVSKLRGLGWSPRACTAERLAAYAGRSA